MHTLITSLPLSLNQGNGAAEENLPPALSTPNRGQGLEMRVLQNLDQTLKC